ncbi:MAG: hypothetical protein QNJ63_26965 [Calothrix sp. MO_192.B10]|nr:hypothetical protein [Calothrix sp. MO_192.B10]
MDSITVSDNTSPFEEIKQIDASGIEYWLATELLTLMGYRTWKRIKDTVERAVRSAQTMPKSGDRILLSFPNK